MPDKGGGGGKANEGNIQSSQHWGGAHLRVLGEEVVGVDVDGREVPDGVELERDLDGPRLPRVVLPADPLVAWRGRGEEWSEAG